MEVSEAVGVAVVAILLAGIVLPFVHHPYPVIETPSLPMISFEPEWVPGEELPEFKSLRARVDDGILVVKKGAYAIYTSEAKGTYAYSLSDKVLNLTVSDLSVKVGVPAKLEELAVSLKDGMLNLGVGAERATINLSNGMLYGDLNGTSWVSISVFNALGNLDIYADGGQIIVETANTMFTLNIYLPRDVGLKVAGEAVNAGFELRINGESFGSGYTDPNYESYSKKLEVRYDVSNGFLKINVERE